jgi:hypothetical protein
MRAIGWSSNGMALDIRQAMLMAATRCDPRRDHGASFPVWYGHWGLGIDPGLGVVASLGDESTGAGGIRCRPG